MSLAASSPTHRTPPGPLRLRRLALGLTQSDVARAAGLSREQIVRLEASRCDPHWRTVKALVGVLGADADQLFPINSEAPAVTPGPRAKSASGVAAHGAA